METILQSWIFFWKDGKTSWTLVDVLYPSGNLQENTHPNHLTKTCQRSWSQTSGFKLPHFH